MIKHLLFSLLLCSWLCTAQAQWQAISNYAGGSTYSAASFVIGNTAYVGGGNPSQRGMFSYDPNSDAWTAAGNIAGNVNRASPIAFSINGIGYIGGGGDKGAGVTNSFYAYDPETETWTEKASFSGGKQHSGCYVSTATKGYVIAGTADSGPTDHTWEYDPTSDTWTEKAAFPGGATYWPSGFEIDGKIYVGVGSGPSGVSTDFYEYDPGTDKWTQKASFPGDARSSAVGFAYNGKGYIGGGLNGSFTSSFGDFYEYNPDKDEWSAMPSLASPVNSTAWSTAFVIGSTVYFGTGASVSGGIAPSAKFYKADLGGSTEVQEYKNQAANSVAIFPNPGTGSIRIDVGTNDVTKLEIIDVQGNTVRSLVGIKTSVEVNQLPVGVYIVRVRLAEGGESIQRLLVY